MAGKVCLITGATSGIGYEMALGLARLGAHIGIVGRDPVRSSDARNRIGNLAKTASIDLFIGDLSSMSDVRSIADNVLEKHNRLDVLINNAGITMGERRITPDGFETTFAVNHLSHFLLTNLLLDLMVSSGPSRIINVSSQAHRNEKLDLDNLNSEKSFGGFKAYSVSKLANVMFTYELASRLAGTETTVNALHPGVVRTGIAREGSSLLRLGWTLISPFKISREKGAETAIYLASSPEVARTTGKYFIRKKVQPTVSHSYDKAQWKELWDRSAAMVGWGAPRDPS